VAVLDVLTTDEALDVVDSPGASTVKLDAIVSAVSARLDELVGPVVRRTITTERHVGSYGCAAVSLRRFPIASVTTVLEYSSSGASTALTEETSTVKPGEGFLLAPTLAEPELELFGPALYRRASGGPATFESEVSVTYIAGRFETTAAVSERYKEAARICVANLWQRVAPGAGRVGEYDAPRFPFPSFAVPTAARLLLLDVWQERAGTLGIA